MESNAERRRKRIVEHYIGPFDSAWEAVRFGNTIESLVNERLGKTKFRQSIGATKTKLAISERYMDDTVLKTIFLEIPGDDEAQYIVNQVARAVEVHNNEYAGRVEIIKHIIREKPAPQVIGISIGQLYGGKQ